MKKKMIAVAGVAVLAFGAFGCQMEPNQAICNDAPKFIKAIESVQAEDAGYKSELLEDAQEYAANPGYCPGFEGMAEEE